MALLIFSILLLVSLPYGTAILFGVASERLIGAGETLSGWFAVAGLFFGLAFGIGGIGAAVLGKVADVTDIAYVYKVCSFIPLIGLLTAFLPNIETKRPAA